MSETIVNVPDIGDAGDVEVIEVSVSVGERVEAEQTLIVLESDKASMEIPAPQAGLVKALNVSVGDKVSEGSAIVTLETDAEQASQAEVSTPDEPPPAVEAVVTPDAAEEVESVEPISNATEVLTEAVKVPPLRLPWKFLRHRRVWLKR